MWKAFLLWKIVTRINGNYPFAGIVAGSLYFVVFDVIDVLLISSVWIAGVWGWAFASPYTLCPKTLLVIGCLTDDCFSYTYNSNNQLSLLVLYFIAITEYYPLIRLLSMGSFLIFWISESTSDSISCFTLIPQHFFLWDDFVYWDVFLPLRVIESEFRLEFVLTGAYNPPPKPMGK